MSKDEDVIRISTTSASTADTAAIVLRQSETSRLVFRPVLLDNAGDPDASIHGDFVYQRKSQRDSWEDHNTLPLSRLKAGEWVRLELKAAEVLKLVRELDKYYALVSQHGLGRGTSEYMPVPKSEALRALVQDEEQFAASLQDEDLARTLIAALLSWIYNNENAIVAARLEGISTDQLQQFDAVLALARLERFCHELDQHAAEPNEDYWQALLEQYSWVIAQVYAIPLMIVRGQVYVGGKTLSNRGGNTADFLYENKISGNVVLVEIKTPASPIVGQLYRNNVHNTSRDVAGGVLQILNAKQSLLEGYRRLVGNELKSAIALSPRGLLIVGSQERGSLSTEQLRSFELFRNNQRDIDIVTFDELRSKVQTMVDLLQMAGK
jgi:hypothetical protein